MGYLKIIFYGLLAFIERHPVFTFALVAVGIFAPAVFKVAGWIILGILLAIVVLVALGSLRLRRMRREMEELRQHHAMSTQAMSFNHKVGTVVAHADNVTLQYLDAV